MAMTDAEIEDAILERLSSWGVFLKHNHATPGMVIGCDQHRRQLVMAVPNETTPEMIEQLLNAALVLVRQGKIVEA